ncbi:stressosome-associated protein Prli42 [Sporosarcina sp. ANT_H38]|nr:stressosome-associated protein Prli42 [Sporosarcina sp. ANT_H38]
MSNRKVQKVVVLIMVGAMLASSVMFGLSMIMS